MLLIEEGFFFADDLSVRMSLCTGEMSDGTDNRVRDYDIEGTPSEDFDVAPVRLTSHEFRVWVSEYAGNILDETDDSACDENETEDEESADFTFSVVAAAAADSARLGARGT